MKVWSNVTGGNATGQNYLNEIIEYLSSSLEDCGLFWIQNNNVYIIDVFKGKK